MSKQKLERTEPKYPVGIAACYEYEHYRARIVAAKWSNESGWWYDIRYPNGVERSVPEATVIPLED